MENFKDGSPIEEISENFAIPDTTIRAVLAFAADESRQIDQPLLPKVIRENGVITCLLSANF